MSREIKRLAAPSNATDASTVSGSNSTAITVFRPTRWEKEIDRIGQDYRFFQQVVDQVKLQPGEYTVRIPIEESHLDITTSHTENDERTYTELTNLHYVDITPSWKLGAVIISREIVSATRIDLVEHAKYTIAEDVEQDVEAAIETAAQSISNNKTYGGDATSTSTLETGDVLTANVLSQGIQDIKENNFEGAGKEKGWIFIHPKQEGALLRDSQFTNAAEFGSDDVVLNGKIATYLGYKIVSTTNVSGATDWGSGSSLSGHYFYVFGKKKNGKAGISLAWNAEGEPAVNVEYKHRTAAHYIYYDACYAASIVYDVSMSIGHVSDA